MVYNEYFTGFYHIAVYRNLSYEVDNPEHTMTQAISSHKRATEQTSNSE